MIIRLRWRLFAALAWCLAPAAALAAKNAPAHGPAAQILSAQSRAGENNGSVGQAGGVGGVSGDAIQVSSGVSYQLIDRWDVARLNAILTEELPTFSSSTVSLTPATNGVALYRVTYASVVPEQNNRPITATGLLAVPEYADAPANGATAKATRAPLPMVSYQHGTVFGKQQVPSFPEQSEETRLMLAQFAGQGYLMIGADYFGMGGSSEPEGYGVKASHQQATLDMLQASRAVLAHMQITPGPLYLAGWSQGGLVSFAFLERLEGLGMAVEAAATASAPVDIFATLNGFLNFPRKIDASWSAALFILSAFSFENYYDAPGLARALFTEGAYDVARRVYLREKVEAAEIPTALNKLVRPEYFNPEFFARSAYGRLVAQTTAYRWVITTPTRAYYGEADEVIRTELGQLPMTWQRAMGNERVTAISTGATDHRGTFVSAMPQWKQWFDSRIQAR